jgi:hypothetical protein
MISIIILGLLCLGAASMLLRVVLFILGKSDHRPLAKIASIAGAIGFLPVIAFEWVCNLALICGLVFAIYHLLLSFVTM